MMNTSLLAPSALPWAALAAALFAAGCAAPKDALAPPVAAMEPPAQVVPLAEPVSEPHPASIAALGLRGVSTPATPAGGASPASAGRADAEDADASGITISYPPTDEEGLDALLTTLADAEPTEVELIAEPAASIEQPEPIMTMAEPALEPVPEPAAGAEPEPFEMTALTANPSYPLTPSEVVHERPTAPAAAETEVEAAAVEPVTAPEALPEPIAEPETMTLAAAETSMIIPTPSPNTATEAEPEAATASTDLQRLEDFYTCNYAPAQRLGNVQLVTCQ